MVDNYCRGVLDGSMADKDESSLEIAQPVPINTGDIFFRIRKKTGHMLNLETLRQNALTIIEVKSKRHQSPSRGLSSERVLDPKPNYYSPTRTLKGKAKSISTYKIRSQSEMSLPEVAKKKRRLVLHSLRESKKAKVNLR